MSIYFVRVLSRFLVQPNLIKIESMSACRIQFTQMRLSLLLRNFAEIFGLQNSLQTTGAISGPKLYIQ